MKSKKEVMELSDDKFIEWCIGVCPKISSKNIQNIGLNIFRDIVKKYYNPLVYPLEVYPLEVYPLEVYPHERCNIVGNDKLLMVGAYPLNPSGFEKLLDYGIDVFVNLAPEPYEYKLPTNKIIIHEPVAKGKFLSHAKAKIILDRLLQFHKEKKKIYIHCHGGHGRAGTMMALLIGKLKRLNAAEAIKLVEEGHSTRIDTSKSYIPTPETNVQVQFLINELGLPEGVPRPDRSDTSWMKTKKAPIQITNLDTSNTIYFYTDTEYKEFSNFYKSPITIKIGNGSLSETVLCDTVEHCYQAQKFMGPNATKDDLEYAKLIATQSTPNKAFILAKQQHKGGYAWVNILNEQIKKYKAKGVKMRSDWDDVKVDVMRQLLIEKFKNPTLKKLLLSTKNKIIHEHTNRDKFWGDNLDGSGKSMLGKLLMEIRDNLKK